jgi:hypothetical protein
VQIAAVLAKPIPNYFVGTDNAPEGLAFVGERGQEMIEKDGKFALTPNRPTLTYLEQGTKVYTAEETKRMIDNESMRDSLVNSYVDGHGKLVLAQQPGLSMEEVEYMISVKMGNHFERLAQVIKDKTEFNLNVTKEGVRFIAKKDGSETEYLNEKYYHRK